MNLITRLQHLTLLVAILMLALMHSPLSAQAQPEPLPLVYSPTGVLFRVKAPGAQTVHLAGTFNGWAGSNGKTVADPTAKMYGPDENGIFEIFYSLTPGRHTFKYCVDGTRWIQGPKDLPTAKDDFDIAEGQNGMPGSAFMFALQEPPWPSYVPTTEMLPTVLVHNTTGKPYLRVRFFSRQAKSAHVVGSWDGWAGISNRSVADNARAMTPTRVPNIWEKYVGPLKEGMVEYKVVVNNRQWLSDPSVKEFSQDGNTMVRIVKAGDKWAPMYTPRFDPRAVRKETKSRWGGTLPWEDDRDAGFAQAQLTKKKMIWVITLPKSQLSENLMKTVNTDPEIVTQLENFICLETAANEVDDIIRQRKIYRLPYVVLVDSKYKPAWEGFNPDAATLKAKLAALQ